MNEMEQKIANLQKLVEKQNRSFHNAVVRTVIIYGLLLLFVLAYTSILFANIDSAVKPETVAELLSEHVRGKMPAVTKNLRSQFKPAAERMAGKSVDVVLEMIPEGTEYLRNLLDIQLEETMISLEKDQIPVIQKILEESLDDVVKHKQDIKSGAIGKALSGAAIQRINKELKQVLDDRFFSGIRELRMCLVNLRTTPPAKMDRQSYSERMFIMYWLYYLDKASVNENDAYSTFIRTANKTIENFKLELDPAPAAK